MRNPINFALLAASLDDTVVPPGWSPPLVCPPMWQEIERGEDGAKWMSVAQGLSAILSCRYEADRRAWLHVSVAHVSRMPKWREIVEVKEWLLGDREAYQVIPPRERYVDIHPRCLHLFALLDGSAALPDFTGGSGSL